MDIERSGDAYRQAYRIDSGPDRLGRNPIGLGFGRIDSEQPNVRVGPTGHTSLRHPGHQCVISGSWQVEMLSMLRLLLLVVGVCGAAIGCASTPSPPVTPDLIQVVATTISSGGNHTCALLPDGSPVCWGANDYGQAPGVFTPPPKLTAITSGGSHSCGLGADGSWTCWGSYPHDPDRPRGPSEYYSAATPKDEVEPPDRHERFVIISSGLDHVCALRPNGEAVCWGLTISVRLPRLRGNYSEQSVVASRIRARCVLTTRPCAGAGLIGLGPVHTNESKCFIIVGWNSQKLNTNASPPICPSNAAT